MMEINPEGRISVPNYEIWSSQQIELPPRSHLYYLETIGVGTPHAESVKSYTVRLAQAHGVWPRTLIVSEILPLFGRFYLANSDYHSLTTFWTNNARALNGTGELAADWVRVLEVLTKRTDLRFLTMLTWAEVLPQRGLLRHRRGWCPACYEQWRREGQIVYDPILWSFEVVTTCPHHNQRLSFQCPYCQKDLPFLGAKAKPGYCPYCGRWLGSLSGTNESLSEDELTWQHWVVESVGELIAAAPYLSEPPSKERVKETMTAYIEQTAGGDASAFTGSLQQANIQISKWSVWDWQLGRQLPQLSMLLQLCYFLGTKPLPFLTGETLLPASSQVNEPLGGTIQATLYPNRLPFNLESLRQALKAIKDSDDYPPLSMAEAARRLGHDQSHLFKLFPELCRPISARYRAYCQAQSLQRKERVRHEVRQAVLKVHAQGKYPSLRQTRALLSDPNLMRLPEAIEAWRETVLELGWVKGEGYANGVSQSIPIET